MIIFLRIDRRETSYIPDPWNAFSFMEKCFSIPQTLFSDRIAVIVLIFGENKQNGWLWWWLKHDFHLKTISKKAKGWVRLMLHMCLLLFVRASAKKSFILISTIGEVQSKPWLARQKKCWFDLTPSRNTKGHKFMTKSGMCDTRAIIRQAKQSKREEGV